MAHFGNIILTSIVTHGNSDKIPRDKSCHYWRAYLYLEFMTADCCHQVLVMRVSTSQLAQLKVCFHTPPMVRVKVWFCGSSVAKF